MLSYRETYQSLRKLALERQVPLLVHAAPAVVRDIQGGEDSLLGVLLSLFQTVLAPAFTYRTLLVPEVGPANNALRYGAALDRNLEAEFFRPGLPVDPNLGELAEKLRSFRGAQRSSHPILSFSGVNAAEYLEAQTLERPFGSVGAMAQAGGWVLLLGVDHTWNASLHWAEYLAGRKQFTRWALTTQGVVECPEFPGCSQGFNAIQGRLDGLERCSQVGTVKAAAYPLYELIEIVRTWIAAEPEALLCLREDCEFCAEVRAANSQSAPEEFESRGLGGEWTSENIQEG
jgi:aminoglycoside 3-N-acetyltransferase